MSAYNPPIFHNGVVNSIFNPDDYNKTDDTYVDITSNQTISGGKTFINGIVVNQITTSQSIVNSGTTTIHQLYEAQTKAEFASNIITLDYSLSSVFYVASDITITANMSIIITNIPTDTTKSYTITLIYYQTGTGYYANQARISDGGGSYLLGTSSTYGTPFFSNGTPSLSSLPSITIQTFSIITRFNNAETSATRSVISSINQNI